ncbi:MAG: ABC transporter ATP-binding protein [Rhizomicrobium sp.]
MSDHVVEIDGFSLAFATDNGPLPVLDAIALAVGAGEIVGLVGESGSGKSVTATTLLRLLPKAGWSASGTIRVLGKDMLAMREPELEDFRGAKISMIFQETSNALDPLLRVGDQIAEVVRRHGRTTSREASARAKGLLADMQIVDVERIMRAYPFMLSGGMRQRVLIAMAFACSPAVLVADEPTTALDVTVQAKILRLLRDKARRSGTSVLLITHDMGIVRHLCDRVYVIHAGQIVEQGRTADVLLSPAHPYTQALLAASPERYASKQAIPTLRATAGPSQRAVGCRFAPRCGLAHEACRVKPGFTPLSQTHETACWAVQEASAHG